jgi:hypothetical protein
VVVFLWLFGDSIYLPVDECSGQIVAPGFSEKVFELVWNTSTSVVHEMMEAEGLAALEPCEKADVKDITHLTIRVSAGVRCGYNPVMSLMSNDLISVGSGRPR